MYYLQKHEAIDYTSVHSLKYIAGNIKQSQNPQ